MQMGTMVLFGEAEKGDFHTAYYCRNMAQLMECFGNPPHQSHGLDYAIQALLFRFHLLFFRVREEGFSEQDYFVGMKILMEQSAISDIMAICMPGVGDCHIINAVVPVCKTYHSILVISESDLYDYFTHI
jgi:hypothetical protein